MISTTGYQAAPCALGLIRSSLWSTSTRAVDDDIYHRGPGCAPRAWADPLLLLVGLYAALAGRPLRDAAHDTSVALLTGVFPYLDSPRGSPSRRDPSCPWGRSYLNAGATQAATSGRVAFTASDPSRAISPLCRHFTLAHGSALECGGYGWHVWQRASA